MNEPASPSPYMRLIAFGFRQLYTRFAWTYDLVAAGVSFGEWQAWGRCAIPFIRGKHVLELAHGPGHLHLALRRLGYAAVGLDLSWEMGVVALDRSVRAGLEGMLARADARRLPFPDQKFDTVVSTFPTSFIFAAETLQEARRVLTRDGIMVVVPGAAFRKTRHAEGLVSGLYRVTRQGETRLEAVSSQFAASGFVLDARSVATRRANVSVWVCRKA